MSVFRNLGLVSVLLMLPSLATAPPVAADAKPGMDRDKQDSKAADSAKSGESSNGSKDKADKADKAPAKKSEPVSTASKSSGEKVA